MKKILLLLSFCTSVAFAQETVKPTNQFSIGGKVKKGSVITMDSLKQYTIQTIGDIKITDHTGVFKHEDDKLKGILIKDVLSHTQFDVGSPKLLSTLYFVFVAADGYKVVYSSNELYNTEVGNHVYILMEKNGVKTSAMKESLQMTSMMDLKTGRRYLHNLDKIIVGMAE
ncbi:molybdopterin-binding protein [Mucilaginibacter sp. S1162]|uniref:Molybdopterin-binding protein n=1 Tax=Mucilaginibacter humi TaxID=2732510 RepID=A0ABX1VZF9_9SPHI|nr:molybdopterin-binding protein [Mucilaginibacter humi]NNU33312.1 molybdopterin-binding protein [Mucilaginibacter humi]